MSRWLRIAVPLGLAAVLVSVLAIGFGSPSSLAAPGGNGNGKAVGHGKGHSTDAHMSVEGTPFAAWGEEQYTVNGSDFEPNKWVNVVVSDPGCCLGFNQWADSDGGFSFTRLTGDPGTYSIDAYQWNGHKYVLKATVSFSVVEP